MTAIEAREITQSKKRGIAEVRRAMTAMAEAGEDFATFDVNKVINPEAIAKELLADGFDVSIDNYFLKVKW